MDLRSRRPKTRSSIAKCSNDDDSPAEEITSTKEIGEHSGATPISDRSKRLERSKKQLPVPISSIGTVESEIIKDQSQTYITGNVSIENKPMDCESKKVENESEVCLQEGNVGTISPDQKEDDTADTSEIKINLNPNQSGEVLETVEDSLTIPHVENLASQKDIAELGDTIKESNSFVSTIETELEETELNISSANENIELKNYTTDDNLELENDEGESDEIASKSHEINEEKDIPVESIDNLIEINLHTDEDMNQSKDDFQSTSDDNKTDSKNKLFKDDCHIVDEMESKSPEINEEIDIPIESADNLIEMNLHTDEDMNQSKDDFQSASDDNKTDSINKLLEDDCHIVDEMESKSPEINDKIDIPIESADNLVEKVMNLHSDEVDMNPSKDDIQSASNDKTDSNNKLLEDECHSIDDMESKSPEINEEKDIPIESADNLIETNLHTDEDMNQIKDDFQSASDDNKADSINKLLEDDCHIVDEMESKSPEINDEIDIPIESADNLVEKVMNLHTDEVDMNPSKDDIQSASNDKTDSNNKLLEDVCHSIDDMESKSPEKNEEKDIPIESADNLRNEVLNMQSVEESVNQIKFDFQSVSEDNITDSNNELLSNPEKQSVEDELTTKQSDSNEAEDECCIIDEIEAKSLEMNEGKDFPIKSTENLDDKQSNEENKNQSNEFCHSSLNEDAVDISEVGEDVIEIMSKENNIESSNELTSMTENQNTGNNLKITELESTGTKSEDDCCIVSEIESISVDTENKGNSLECTDIEICSDKDHNDSDVEANLKEIAEVGESISDDFEKKEEEGTILELEEFILNSVENEVDKKKKSSDNSSKQLLDKNSHDDDDDIVVIQCNESLYDEMDDSHMNENLTSNDDIGEKGSIEVGSNIVDSLQLVAQYSDTESQTEIQELEAAIQLAGENDDDKEEKFDFTKFMVNFEAKGNFSSIDDDMALSDTPEEQDEEMADFDSDGDNLSDSGNLEEASEQDSVSNLKQNNEQTINEDEENLDPVSKDVPDADKQLDDDTTTVDENVGKDDDSKVITENISENDKTEKTTNDKILTTSTSDENKEKFDDENKEKLDDENKEKLDDENKEKLDDENKEKLDDENKEKLDDENKEKLDDENKEKLDDENKEKLDDENKEKPDDENKEKLDDENNEKLDKKKLDDKKIMELISEEEEHLTIDKSLPNEKVVSELFKKSTSSIKVTLNKHFIETEGINICDNESIFERIVIVGDNYLSSIIKFWPKESKLKPYFLCSESVQTHKLLESIKNHNVFQSKNKTLLIVIPNVADVIMYAEFVKNCKYSHNHFKIPSSNVDPTSITNIIKQLNVAKTNLENQYKNLTIMFSFIPLLNLVDNMKKLFNEERDKTSAKMKCSCRFPGLKGDKKKDFITNYRSLVEDLNHRIFNLKWTQHGWVNSYRFLDFTPYSVNFFNGKWIPDSDDVKKLDATNLASSVQVVLFGKKEPINVHDDISKTVLEDAQHFAKSQFKTLVIGDEWLKGVINGWQHSPSLVKPFFFVDSSLVIATVQKRILSITKKDEQWMVVICLGISNFVNFKEYPACFDHDPLCYPIPKEKLTEDPVKFSSQLWEQIIAMKAEIMKRRKNCKIVFTTCFPLIFPEINTFLSDQHLVNTEHRIYDALTSYHNFSHLKGFVMKKALSIINNNIITLNNELHSCDLYSFCLRLRSQNSNVIPFYDKEQVDVIEKLQYLLKEYLDSLKITHYKRGFTFSSESYSASYEESVNEQDLIIERKELAEKPPLPKPVIKNRPPDLTSKTKVEIKENQSKKEKSKTEKEDKSKIRDDSKTKSNIGKEDVVNKSDTKATKPLSPRIRIKKDSSLMEKSEPVKRSPKRENARSPKRELARSPKRDTGVPSVYYPQYNYMSRHRMYSKNRSRSKSLSRNYHSRRSRSRSRHRSRSQSYRRSRSRSYRRSRSRRRSRDRNYRRSPSRSRRRSRSRNYRSRSESDQSESKSYNFHIDDRHSKKKRSRQSSSCSSESSQDIKKKKKKTSKESKKFSRAQNIALDNLWDIHQRECNMYRQNPAAHPDHDRLKRMWQDAMMMQGFNQSRRLLEKEWVFYWREKVEKIFEEAWQQKRTQTLSLLESSPGSSSGDDTKRSKKKKHKSSKKKRKHKRERSSSIEVMEELPPIKKKSLVEQEEPTSSVDLLGSIKMENMKALDMSLQDVSIQDVTSVLAEISDRFGALGVSVSLLHKSVRAALATGTDPMSCIDDDARMLLTLIEGKIQKQVNDSSMSLVQRAITQEALDRLTPFLKNLEKKPETEKFNIDIDIIAMATMGKDVKDIVTFIQNALAYKKIPNYTNDDVMKLYMAVKTAQGKIDSHPIGRQQPPPSNPTVRYPISAPSRFSSSSFQPEESFYSRPGPSSGAYLSYSSGESSRPRPSQEPEKSFKLYDRQSKNEQYKKHFMQLPMNEKIRKFASFNSLPYEEKNFLLSHVDWLEKSDPKLALSLRWMISNNS